MVPFVIFVLGPALIFNVCSLSQFWREARRAAAARRRQVPLGQGATSVVAQAWHIDGALLRVVKTSEGQVASDRRKLVRFRSRNKELGQRPTSST